MGVTFGLIWMVPVGWTDTAQITWFVIFSILFFTCSTIFSVPLMSLYYEASPDYDDRTRIMGASTFWNRVSELSHMALFPLAQWSIFASVVSGVRTVAWASAILLIIIPGIVPALIGRERFGKVANKQEKVKLLTTLKSAFANKAFMILISVIVIVVLSGTIGSVMDYYLLVYFVHGGDLAAGSVSKLILSVSYTVVGFAAIPVLNYFSSRIGKKETLYAVMVLYAVGQMARWFIFQPGIGWWIVVDPLLGGGVLWVALNMVVHSMFADLCDEDELQNGQRREGIFGAAFSWLVKLGYSLSMVTVGLSLNFVEFDESLGGDQAPGTITGMRLLMTVLPCSAALLCIFILKRFPIDRSAAAETRRLLEERRGESADG
jgi:GPH family glycoside/pentoside/hexuronide:cation symporter